jgi:transcriptional antiterminator RfaH
MNQWYVVQTKSRRELDAEENLKRQGYETYLPRIMISKRRRGKFQPVVEPLFPRYLFVHIDPEVMNISPIRSTVGVSQMVRFGHVLVAVPDQVINYLKLNEDRQAGCYIPAEDKYVKGDPVEIVEGPFAGLKGVFDASSGDERVIVLLNVLGTANRLNLKSSQVTRLS